MAMSLKESLEYIQSSSVTPASLSLKTNPEPEITVDMDARTIKVPSELQNIGVVSDDNCETVYIRIPSTTFDDISLTDKTAYINYINAGKEYNSYKITDVQIENDTLKLGWTIDNNVTRYAGTVSFQITFELDQGYKWSTLPATFNIMAGLNIDSTIPSAQTAIVSSLFDRMTNLESTVYNNTAITNEIRNEFDSLQEQIDDLQKEINNLQEEIDYLKNHVVYILDNTD